MRAWARARWLAGVLRELASVEGAPEGLRLALELYGVGKAVRVDGAVLVWIGPTPHDADMVAWCLDGEAASGAGVRAVAWWTMAA
ncbi:hypothetical protein [Catenulispora rubra]|uniref:hypothetical protein n=1 Tax=Catenulispora rubra TaxID=280293 RepID=UPI0018925B6C|nr:hypothetical protein [Catenulispora rubra]